MVNPDCIATAGEFIIFVPRFIIQERVVVNINSKNCVKPVVVKKSLVFPIYFIRKRFLSGLYHFLAWQITIGYKSTA